jgi:hypothetical protein
VIQVAAAGQQAWFLVDTAATSMLNLESFARGLPRDVRVTSWSGTLATSAKEVTIAELVVGRTTLVGLKLPAIDLSAIGKACGRRIDRILGVDLLGKIGATIDLKRELVHVTTAEEERGAKLVSEMQRETERCKKAFNDSSEDMFADCLDPKIVLFTAIRAAARQLPDRRLPGSNPRTRLSCQPLTSSARGVPGREKRSSNLHKTVHATFHRFSLTSDYYSRTINPG